MAEITNDQEALQAVKKNILKFFPDAFYEFYHELMMKAEGAVTMEDNTFPIQSQCEDGEMWYDFIRDDEHDFITDLIINSINKQ